jgi:hypothetical protein
MARDGRPVSDPSVNKEPTVPPRDHKGRFAADHRALVAHEIRQAGPRTPNPDGARYPSNARAWRRAHPNRVLDACPPPGRQALVTLGGAARRQIDPGPLGNVLSPLPAEAHFNFEASPSLRSGRALPRCARRSRRPLPPHRGAVSALPGDGGAVKLPRRTSGPDLPRRRRISERPGLPPKQTPPTPALSPKRMRYSLCSPCWP